MAMTKKLYNLMDWAEIEAVTYAEEDHPKAVLGAHPVRGGQTLVTTYQPDASEVSVKVKGTRASVKMELADEDGYFAVLVKNREPFEYELEITDKEGNEKVINDPYAYPDSITKRDIQKFSSGINYRVYEMLGSHVTKMNGVSGVRFAVWAPNALRVSVVGDFNGWDGRLHQMERLFDSGIFELFIPAVEEGEKYKYEIKLHSGQTIMKRDPYAFLKEENDDPASIVYDLDRVPGSDSSWLEKRDEVQSDDAPVMIYDHGETDFSKKEAKEIAKYAGEYGYTHVTVSGVFDPLYIGDSDPEEIADFTDALHKAGIAVLIRWMPAAFSNDEGGLSVFDGTCIYEDGDGKRAYVPGSERKYFNLGRDGVKNYLLGNAMFLLDVLHFDGLVVSDVARMLYLDYGKSEGGWTPNMYGGNENLDAIDLFRQLSTTIHKYSSDILLISDDDTTFPGITASVDDEGLGFDYKINHGWNRDVLGYMRQEPLGRSNHYNEICFPMIYQYNERFILPVYDTADIWKDMPGDRDEKFGNLRTLISYFIMHPGKKMMTAQSPEGKAKEIQAVQTLIKDAVAFYRKNETLYSKELEPAGFEWINNISARENILVFSRRGNKKDDIFVVVANFANVPHKGYKIGVPKAGRYTEVFCSDAEKYDGFGFVNKNPIFSDASECDGRNDSIRIRVAPLSVSVYKYSPAKNAK